MKTIRNFSLCLAALLSASMSGCATTGYRPAVDYGQPKGDYQADLDDCSQLAQTQGDPAQHAAGAAAAGAVLGALLGAAVGLRGSNVARAAAAGAVQAGAAGAVYGSEQWKRIVDGCMRGRGYPVVS